MDRPHGLIANVAQKFTEHLHKFDFADFTPQKQGKHTKHTARPAVTAAPGKPFKSVLIEDS
jgi:hypothetical protein